MTKEAAIEAMKQGGYKVRHRLFGRDEFIWCVHDEYYIDESGYLLPESDFWAYRKGVEWETGWEIVE